MSLPTTTIRRAGAEDAASLAALINRAFVVEGFFVDGDRLDVAEVDARMRTGAFLILDEDGELAGSVYTERRPESQGYIGLLAVEPARHGRGIGKRLMAAAEEWCESSGCTVVEITVVSVRTELFPFYAALGYEARSQEPFSERPTKVPCHFVIMTKSLARTERDPHPVRFA